MFRSLSDLSELNPKFQCPSTMEPSDLVSFIPMGDVSDSGHWMTKRTRPLKSVRQGFTPFANGDVLFAKITPCMENGKGAHVVGLTNGVGFGSTEFHVLRPKPEADARFIFHHTQHRALRSAAEAAMTGSAGQKRVPTEFFHKWKVYAPGKEEQSRIADILDSLDTQTQRTEALIAKLEKIKEGLLHDLLSRGIDQNSQLRPTPEQAPELYKESALGLIPKDWEVRQLGSMSEIVSGVTLGGQQPSSSWPLVAYLRVANVQDGYLDLRQVKFLRVKPEDVKKYRLISGDVLMNEGGDFDKLGRGTVWEGEIEQCIHQNHVFRVRTSPNLLEPYFLAYFSGSSMGKSYFVKSSKQSTNLASINSTQLKAFEVPVPPLHEQKVIVDLLQSQMNHLKLEDLSLVKLQAQKGGMMDDLLTGRVRVTTLLPSP